MKILILSNLYPPHWLGGYEILCAQVADELARRGHDVQVLTSDYAVKATPVGGGVPSQDTAPPLDAARAGAPTVHRLLSLTHPFHKPRPRLLRARSLGVSRHNHEVTSAFIRRYRPDVVFVWSLLRLTPSPGRAAAASGVPVCHSLNDEHLAGYLPLTPGWNPLSLARHAVDRTWLRVHTLEGLDLRHVTCISQRVKRNLVARGVPVERAQVIYQGVRLERFPMRHGIERAGGPLRLLYVGQLQPYKGVHTVIEAAHALAADRDVRLTVVGDGFGPYQEQLAKLIAAGPGNVRLAGRVPHDEVAACYHAHDVFVFPSIWEEPFGLVPLEAMACGIPVVSTANGGHGEFLRHGLNALVFEPGNKTQLASHIARLADDETLRQRLAREGRKAVERDFCFDRYVDQLEDFVFHAVGRLPEKPRYAAVPS